MSLRCPTSGNHGVVLVVVLWALVLLTALCLALHTAVRWRAAQTKSTAADDRAEQACLSGIELARAVLAADRRDVDCLADPWAAGGAATFAAAVNGGVVSVLDPSTDPMDWGLADETARLNANTVTANMLARLPAVTLAAAEAFVAVRATLATRIAAANGALAEPAQGVTGPITDPDQLGRLLCEAMGEPLPGSHASRGTARAWPTAVNETMRHLTVYSRTWNLDADRERRLNLNTATIAELTDRFGTELDDLQIQAIVLSRQTRAFASVGELLTRDLVARVPEDGDIPVAISREQVRRIVDRLTLTDASVLPGLVNVNTAGADVLACLPGMDPALSADLIDHRTTLGPEQLRTIGWLLDVLTDDTFRQIAPHATTRSSQFSLVAVFMEEASEGATCMAATLERAGRRNSVLRLERYRRFWDDKQERANVMAAGLSGR